MASKASRARASRERRWAQDRQALGGGVRWNDKYVALALQNPYGRLLAEEVERRWPEWENMIACTGSKADPLETYAEALWRFGFLRAGLTGSYEALGRYGGPRVEDRKMLHYLEYWLNGIDAELQRRLRRLLT